MKCCMTLHSVWLCGVWRNWGVRTTQHGCRSLAYAEYRFSSHRCCMCCHVLSCAAPFLQVNKVAGNFHFAAGHSYQQGSMHIHDMAPFADKTLDFTHKIHSLSFGSSYPVSAACLACRSGCCWVTSALPDTCSVCYGW